MDDEDGTCLLDVLCDPQALNDFLHGTNELENEDLLINSSPGEPSLFADAPSPGSLLADDTPCQDTPPPGCVDLSFLEEALLGSPEEGGGPEVGQGGPVGASEEEEACDILRQSLQEADITEQTLALEAGLATPGEGLSLYNTPSTLLAPLTSQFLSKPFSAPPLPAMPRDTQVAVEPPQPSLLAVGPGCPSLKPAAPQLMGLLPGTVFPATSPDASFSLSPAQGSGMLIQKALPSLSRPLMTTTLRATAAPGILLPRGPLPIQPKLPVNIQPRLVQISPKPPGQKSSSGLTLVPGTAPPNILLSSPLGSKQPPANPHLSKPVSLQLVNQGGSIVIQPQSLFQGHNQFLLPSQTPVTVSQPISAAQPLLTSANQQGPLVRGGAPPTGQLLDSTQILSAPPRQLNFSPVFTTPTGQLALRQGALLSGPLQLQSASPTVFQMPAQLAGTYTPQGQGQRGTLLHSTALGSHITLINGPGMLTPDMASISIVNGPSVVQGLPFTTQATRPRPGGPEGQYNLPQASVLLLPETSGLEKRSPSEESLVPIPQPNQQLHQHASQIRPAEFQSPPLVTLLQPLSDGPLHSASLLPKDLVPQTDGQQVLEEVSSLAPQKQGLMHTLQQALELPSPSADRLAGTLPVQVAPHVSTLASQSETSTPTLPTMDQAGAPPAIPNPIEVITPTHPGIEQTVSQCSPLIGLTSLSTPPVTFSPASGQGEALSWSGLSKAATAVQPANPVSMVPSPLPVSVSVVQLQSAPLPVPMVSGGQTDLSIQQRTQGKPGAVFSVDSKALTFGLCPASPKIQGSQLQGQYNQRQHIQVTQIQTVLQSRTQVTSCMEMGTEEKVTLAMRRHRFQQRLCLDHAAVLSPEANSPFMSLENAASRLLPYHTCAGNLPGQADFIQVDEQFEAVSGLLLKRATDMLKKYRQLLLGEAQQVSPSAEMVMLERLFLQAERGALVEERRKARLEPESFLMSLRKPVACPSGAAPAAPCPFLQSSSPPSPPSWALLSDRPPGLKTYRSSSRGALKLTIKHESGSRKVVHNSACDAAQTCPSDDKQEGPGQLTNGRDTLSKQEKESKGLPYLQNQTSKLSEGTQPLPAAEEAQHSKPSDVIAGARTGASSLTTADTQSAAPELPIPDSILCPPRSKRPRQDLPLDLPSPLPVGEDSTLNEHLQSAIDSILELQRLQGPSQDSRGASALEQAVNSILEGHL